MGYSETSMMSSPKTAIAKLFDNADIAKISVTSSIVINILTRELLAGDTKNSFV